MIGSLLAELDLSERDAGIARCFLHHLHEELFPHKMRAGAGRQISAARQDLHRTVVDLLVAAEGFMDCLS